MESASIQLIDRPKYLLDLSKWTGQNDLVKIVTGVRRCGKSKLLELFQSNLIMKNLATDEQIISVNLEDPVQAKEIGLTLTENKRLRSYETLLDFILKRLQKEKMNYVFIDEIQLLEDWEQVANALRLRSNVDVYLTGSNAYMFSSDLANVFGGRYVEIKMLPYSFAEYYNAYDNMIGLKAPENRADFLKRNDLQTIYTKYVTESGFPQTVNLAFDQQMINDYLHDTVYMNTLQKDIVRRFNIADSNKLDSVVRYMFDNIGNETSLRSIERGLKAAGYNVSAPSIDVYLKGLLDSYLLYKCERYDIKGKKYLDSNAKYYVVDTGLRGTLLGQKNGDYGHILENVVYLELLRRGYKVSVGRIYSAGKNLEVDFVAQKAGGQVEYYQVALYALEPETLNRELAPLEAIDDNYPKFILSLDFGSGETKGIKRLNVIDWLLNDVKHV